MGASVVIFFFSLYLFPLALYSRIMPITFLLSAQWAALSLRKASVSSLLKPQAVNRPCFTMRNQTFFVSGKQSAVLFRVRPTMHFLCALRYTSAHTYARTCINTHTPTTPTYLSRRRRFGFGEYIFLEDKMTTVKQENPCSERHLMQLHLFSLLFPLNQCCLFLRV